MNWRSCSDITISFFRFNTVRLLSKKIYERLSFRCNLGLKNWKLKLKTQSHEPSCSVYNSIIEIAMASEWQLSNITMKNISHFENIPKLLLEKPILSRSRAIGSVLRRFGSRAVCPNSWRKLRFISMRACHGMAYSLRSFCKDFHPTETSSGLSRSQRTGRYVAASTSISSGGISSPGTA